jgi:hypothetical protein
VEYEDLLWRRVAAFRGIEASKLNERGRLLGERFQIHTSRDHEQKTPEAERVFRLVGDASCEGVVGEIALGEIALKEARARKSTLSMGVSAKNRGAAHSTTPLGWRRALIVREAERLARRQLERRGHDQIE